MAKVEVTDPGGVQWSVYRRRWYWRSADDAGIELEWLAAGTLLLVAWWPFWFIAHWVGLRWKIVTERDGTEVGDERVRGWRKSRRRIQEIAESAAAGTLEQVV
jgi:hypothetical protein